MRILKTRVIALTLAALSMLISVSCGKTDSGDSDSDQNTIETTAYEPEIIDMGGYSFIVNVRGDKTGNGTFACTDFMAEEMNADPINDAVYKRNELIEDMYNCTITQIYASGDQYEEISKSIFAGDPLEAGIVLGTDVAKLAGEGMLLNLYDYDTIDFSRSWWDKNAIDAFTISNCIYFTTGDLNISTNDSTRVTVFSKNIIDNNNFDSPYTLVKEGKWTLGKMFEMALAANSDLDGNTILNKEDQIGLYVYNWSPQFFFYGCGGRVTTMNSSGIPELTLYNDRNAEIVELIWQISNNLRSDTIGGYSSDQYYVFLADRCLFTHTSIFDIRTRYRLEAEEDFGILPLPKYDEAQSEYYNFVSFQNVTHLWCVPVTCSNPEYATTLLEAFARESVETTRKAYYDITLQGKVSRDDESSEMLDLIFASRVYDMVSLFDWGGWDNWFTSLRSQTTNTFASTYDSKLVATKADIDKTIESFAKNTKTK